MSEGVLVDTKSAIEAKYDAQKIAFAPIVFQAARSLRDLGILDLIQTKKRKGITANEISKDLGIDLYGVKVLLELGETVELVYSEDDKFYITKTGYFILNDELTRVNMDFVHDVCYKGMFSLDQSIIKKEPTGLEVFGKWNTIYEALSQLPEKVKKSWFSFDHYYSDIAFSEVLPIVFEDKPKMIFDVGGNTGKWALQCVKYNDSVNVTILDLPGQLNVALKNMANEGFGDRVKGCEINLLDTNNEFPDSPDAIWMSQFLDCFSEAEIVNILQMAGRSMKKETNLFILETYWNRQRFEASKFSLQATSLYFTNMANGNSKMYHSDDLYKCVEEAGMVVIDDIDDIGVSHTLLKVRLKS